MFQRDYVFVITPYNVRKQSHGVLVATGVCPAAVSPNTECKVSGIYVKLPESKHTA